MITQGFQCLVRSLCHASVINQENQIDENEGKNFKYLLGFSLNWFVTPQNKPKKILSNIYIIGQ